jgi:Cof subfamily protein (haloacid dehalogenase superfamily)
MNSYYKMKPKLLAFDLDGTLLNSKKELSATTIQMMQKIEALGIKIAFASGRIKSSIDQYSRLCPFPVSILSLNGAAVYSDVPSGSQKIFSASLQAKYADYLIEHSLKNKILMNYYFEDNLYAIKNEENLPWITLYYKQTSSTYNFVNSFEPMSGNSPSKIIFVGPPAILDHQQQYFTELWGNSVYICRTWDYYLEFLNPLANKGAGLSALADFYAIAQNDIIAFGDAMNDIPMLKFAGYSIAVRNAGESVKNSAKKVSTWSNDDEGVAKELEQIYQYFE